MLIPEDLFTPLYKQVVILIHGTDRNCEPAYMVSSSFFKHRPT